MPPVNVTRRTRIIRRMAKEKTNYCCSECGGVSPKWLGKCPHCNAWNTLIESTVESSAPARNRFASLAKTAEVATLGDIEAMDLDRTPTGHEELDRVLGGGMVEGGVVLIGGDPGIGKSTLLLQALDSLQRSGRSTLYVTGEESGAQIALRSRRLGLGHSQVKVLAEIQLDKILATLEATKPDVAVIDSIQTVYSEQLTSAPGSVAQVRECAAHLTRSKASGVGWCWWVTSPKTVHWPGHACSSTWWTPCCTSKATRTAAFDWCALSRIGLARSMRSGCLP
jgi:DNA repair protein RadA/Sms